jgi:sec-independent protein translocase protein TatA
MIEANINLHSAYLKTMMISVFQMNIGGSEWIIIILVGLILLFGSKKVPEISRTLGRASAEYEKAQQIFRKGMEDSVKPTEAIASFQGPKIVRPMSSEREKLETIANSLGIKDLDQTDDQLRIEISEKVKQSM